MQTENHAKGRRPANSKARNGKAPHGSDSNGARSHANITLYDLRDALRAAERGDFTVRLPIPDGDDILGELAIVFNAIVARNEALAAEMVRVERVVGREGRMTERASLGEAAAAGRRASPRSTRSSATWCSRRPRSRASSAPSPTATSRRRWRSRSRGSRSRASSCASAPPSTRWSISSARSPPRSRASPRRSAPTASSAARPTVRGVAGIWRDLTDNVNLLANNLTAQVRNIAEVTTAVANGDLSKKITVDAKGEVLELKNTINTMVDQLNSFAAEVTRVAQGGRHRGQAGRPGRREGRVAASGRT